MEGLINGWTHVLVSAQTLGQTQGKINGWMMEEGGLFDRQMSTLTDGWLADVLHDRPGDDGGFMFVVLYGCESMRR